MNHNLVQPIPTGEGKYVGDKAYNPPPRCNVPTYIEHRQRLESRKYQLQRELEEVEWAMKKLESQDAQEAMRFQDVINRTDNPL